MLLLNNLYKKTENMIVVDIESTGLEPHAYSLLSIGALDFENPDVQFYEECRAFPGAHVDPKALEINGFTEAQIHDNSKQSEAELIKKFLNWLSEREEQTLAGQNVHVDLSFLEAAAHRAHVDINLASRIIDLHSICYFHIKVNENMKEQGINIPVTHHHSSLNSDSIMKYVGIPAEPHPHIGINGAIWEAEAFHRLFYKKYLFEQFKQYPVIFKL